MTENARHRWALPDEAAQERLGARLAAVCSPPLLIFLHGELGVGKTTLARGFLHGLGHAGAVKSPTYTLVEPYELAQFRVYHLDLYRVADPAELEYLGLREMLAENAILLIEWPQRGAGWLPEADLDMQLQHVGAGRDVEICARGQRGREVLRALLAENQENF